MNIYGISLWLDINQIVKQQNSKYEGVVQFHNTFSSDSDSKKSNRDGRGGAGVGGPSPREW